MWEPLVNENIKIKKNKAYHSLVVWSNFMNFVFKKKWFITASYKKYEKRLQSVHRALPEKIAYYDD